MVLWRTLYWVTKQEENALSVPSSRVFWQQNSEGISTRLTFVRCVFLAILAFAERASGLRNVDYRRGRRRAMG